MANKELDMGRQTINRLFQDHSRDFDSFHYVYPVISRRSGGLSVGINLNVRGICTLIVFTARSIGLRGR